MAGVSSPPAQFRTPSVLRFPGSKQRRMHVPPSLDRHWLLERGALVELFRYGHSLANGSCRLTVWNGPFTYTTPTQNINWRLEVS